MPIVTLSAEFVRNAKCPAGKKKENFYDPGVATGFVLEVRASGSMTYALRYRDSHNRQIQHKIGDAKSISFDKAKTAARQLRSRIVLGEDPAEDKRIKRIVPTLSDFFYKQVLPYSKSSGKRSWKSDVSAFKNHLENEFGDRHLDEITHQEVIEFHHDMHAVGYAKATCNRTLVLLKLIYNLGRRWKIPGAEPSPCNDVHYFQANNERELFLTAEQTQRLMEQLQKSQNSQLKYIVPIALMTGARKRELLDATWDQFDLERRIWRIPMSKSGKARHVPLSMAVLAILKEVPRWDDCPYVVPNPETKQPYVAIFRSWDRARKDAGLPLLRMHDLRHSMASNMVNSGRTIYEVAKVLGHAQIKTSARYSHLSQETLLAAVDAAANATGIDWSQSQA